MTFQDDTICTNCRTGRLVEDSISEERVCNRCGFVISGITELHSIDHVYKSTSQKPTYKIGSDRKFAFSFTDYTGNRIDSQVKRDLMTASKYDREQKEHEKAAVLRITDLYDTILHHTYNDGLKKGDLEILRQRTRNLVDATGEKQSELDLMKVIRKYVRVKLGKNPELKKYFKMDTLHIKIRHQREQPRNISGRGNQIGKNRKEGRIEYCNICKVVIPNYKVKKHHLENHINVPYFQYINKANQYVRRSAKLEDVIIDCSAAREESRNKNETGLCTNCNIPDAIIKRYPQVKILKKGRMDIVSRLVARHKDEKTGKWKVCILQQNKIGKKR